MNTTKSNGKKYIAYSIITIIVILIIIWAFLPSKLHVDVSKVKYGAYAQFIEEDAKTRAMKIYTITAPVTGKLLRIPYLEGDRVNKGDTIAVMQSATPALLDSRTEEELKQQLGAAEAAYEQAISELERAKAALATSLSDLNREKPLIAKGYVSKKDFEHTELAYNLRNREYNVAERRMHVAQHEIDKLKASLSNFNLNNSKSNKQIEIPSPITGKVLRINLKSETTINAGTTIMEIADVAKLEVIADVLSTDAAQIPLQAKVFIKRWGGAVPLEGRVRYIEPSAFTKISALGVEEQRVNVIIDITSSHEIWKNLGDAFRVDVEIILFESPRALLVPMSAVFRDGNDWAVYLAHHNKAIKRNIVIKWHNPDSAVVEKGLNEGDTVVLYPSSLLHEGDRLVYQIP